MAYPTDWYWTGDPGVYGTARGSLVSSPDTDSALATWIDINGVVSPWPRDESGSQTATALDELLSFYGLPPTGIGVAGQKSGLLAAASSASQSLIDQICVVYDLNIFATVAAAGYAAPTGDFATPFSDYASAFGYTSSQLATLLATLSRALMSIAAAAKVLQNSVTSATQSSDLATALTAFETANSAIVSTVNGATPTLPSALVAPSSIVIKGVN